MNKPIYITVENDVIYGYNTDEIIGYTPEKLQQAIDKAKEYKEMLYEHGILERPKTSEQIAEEQNKNISELAELVKSLASTVGTLSNDIKALKKENKNKGAE